LSQHRSSTVFLEILANADLSLTGDNFRLGGDDVSSITAGAVALWDSRDRGDEEGEENGDEGLDALVKV
jgi:hypothetical protein